MAFPPCLKLIKIAGVVAMIKRALKKKLAVDNILIDS